MFGVSALEMEKKDDDFRDVEMFPVPLEEEVVPPDEFVREIYNLAAKRAHRDPSKGIYPSDLLYDMIPQVLKDESIVWWMCDTHPIALMLLENDVNSDGEYEELASMRSALGKIIIYTDDMVKECRDCIIELCRQFKLEILEEPQEIIVERGEEKCDNNNNNTT